MDIAKRIVAWCDVDKDRLHRYFGGEMSEYGDYLTHVDNGSNVLGVCHTDTVMDWRTHAAELGMFLPLSSVANNGTVVESIQLDDRLGCFILAELLPAMGITLDFLFTDCEEIGASTAQGFRPEKEYNWIVGFDRRGLDVVMYQYSDRKRWGEPIEEAGSELGLGSFSDISSMDHLGVVGFNWGVGYHTEHTHSCRCSVKDVLKSAETFSNFYEKWKDEELPWDKSAKVEDDDGWGWWDDEAWVNYLSKKYGDLYFDDDEDIEFDEDLNEDPNAVPEEFDTVSLEELIAEELNE